MEDPKVKNRSQYDTTFKDLFAQPPQVLLRVLLDCQAVSHLSIEFASTQKRLPDLVFLMETHSIFHLELQSQPEDMDWRMLMYYSLIRQRYPDKTLLQKVLYVGQKKWKPSGVLNEKNLQFCYEIVDIRDIDGQRLMGSPLLEENILAILCRVENQEDTIQEILRRISELPTKARADALTKLMVLSSLRKLELKIQNEAKEMALTFNVMENDVLRPLFLKAQMESEKVGEARGEQKILLRQLTRRFGTLAPWVLDRVNAANIETLELWSDRVLDTNTLEEILGPRQ